MTHLNGLYTFDQQHRLYEPVRNLLTLTASVGVAALVVQTKGDIQEPRDAIALSQQFNLDIYLPMAGVLRFAVEDGKPRTIQIAFKKPFPRRPRDTKGNADFPAMFVLAAATAFANFYEAQRDWME